MREEGEKGWSVSLSLDDDGFVHFAFAVLQDEYLMLPPWLERDSPMPCADGSPDGWRGGVWGWFERLKSQVAEQSRTEQLRRVMKAGFELNERWLVMRCHDNGINKDSM